MTEKDAFVRVGKMKDAHGIRGELFIVLFAGQAAWIDKLKEIRLVKDDGSGQAQIFGVKSVREHKNGLIVKSGDIRDRNHAETLKGLLLEIPSSYLVSEKGEELYLAEVEGFRVHTKHRGEVGAIVGFSSNGVQDLLIVETQDGPFEVPFVDAFVEKIDYESGIVYMDLPLGLLGESWEGSDESDHHSSNDSDNDSRDDSDNDSGNRYDAEDTLNRDDG
jgi:16S rRNA processing protein RimM